LTLNYLKIRWFINIELTFYEELFTGVIYILNLKVNVDHLMVHRKNSKHFFLSIEDQDYNA